MSSQEPPILKIYFLNWCWGWSVKKWTLETWQWWLVWNCQFLFLSFKTWLLNLTLVGRWVSNGFLLTHRSNHSISQSESTPQTVILEVCPFFFFILKFFKNWPISCQQREEKLLLATDGMRVSKEFNLPKKYLLLFLSLPCFNVHLFLFSCWFRVATKRWKRSAHKRE